MNSDVQRQDELRAAWHEGYTAALHRRETATWQLDRERMEIVRGLREFRCADIEPWFEMQFWTLLRLLGVESDASTPADCDDVAHLRDRLIHLLGGDQPSGIDVLRAMDAESDKDGTCPNAVQCSSNSANLGERSANNLQDSPNPINKNAESESYLIENADFNKLGEQEKVVRKLQALQFDGGSHENLGKIAYAIYPCATGWTCESCDGLRGMLIRLLGGSDGGRGVSGDVCRRSCADGGAGDSGELAEVVTFANIRKKRDELAATMEQLKDELDRIKGLLQ